MISMIAHLFSEISCAISERLRWEYSAQRGLRARTLRDDGRTKEEVARRHPELAGAMATIRMAELFAAKHLSAEADRVRFMKLVRDAMSHAIEHEAPVPAPKLRDPRTRAPGREARRADARASHGWKTESMNIGNQRAVDTTLPLAGIQYIVSGRIRGR